MRILGIDPGIARMGWGIIQVESSTLRVQNYGCFETPSTDETPARLKSLYNHMLTLIREYKPHALAVEELFFNTNAKTAFVVGQARGVVLLCGALNNLKVTTFTPLQVKIALTGYGRAEKSQVGQMVKTILKLEKIPHPDDTADALAVALTFAFSNKLSIKIPV